MTTLTRTKAWRIPVALVLSAAVGAALIGTQNHAADSRTAATVKAVAQSLPTSDALAAEFPELGEAKTPADDLAAVPPGVDQASVRSLASPVEGWKFWIATSVSGDVGGDGVCLLWESPSDTLNPSVRGPGGICQRATELVQGVVGSSTSDHADKPQTRILWLVPATASAPVIDDTAGAAVSLHRSGSLVVSEPAQVATTTLTVNGTRVTQGGWSGS